MTPSTIHQLIEIYAERAPESTAILGPGRAPLTYERLQRQAQDVVRQLNELGVGRNDRVAIVLPNGPEMAVAFLSIASGATSAPLNPNYRSPEFEFYLSDLNAKALVVLGGMDSPATMVAQALGISVIELTPVTDGPAGLFTLSGDPQQLSASTGLADPEDIALVLHTSGTTSRPKIVPLRHINISTSAGNVGAALALTESDRCLNIMPLFHIHGLIGATLSSISAGASIVCTPGFDESRFFEWMEECRPTWYTAVPTMHQAVLARAPANRKIVAQYPLRLIRSSSSSLPPQVMAELESTFSAPVIESYGMTEASHQMTSNPLPPRQRKAGSVGVPAGPEVAIMDEAGNLLPPETTGEIVIRGANVTRGYESNPAANAGAFSGGWFRTGDQGHMDSDGYFTITGRLKEIINRGGEKIAPREVDEMFLDHPAVAQAVTFAVPHPTLGEDVAAAVILKGGTLAGEEQLREFAFARLADYKVPSQVVIVDEIPKGPTGKLQRIGLAERMAQALKPTFVAPRNPVEGVLASIWTEVLGLERVGVHDNFFAIGGDSILAARVVAGTRRAFQIELPLPTIFQTPTIAQLASVLPGDQEERPVHWSPLVAIQSTGSKLPLFFVPGNMSNVFHNLGGLARHLGPDQPLYGLQDSIHSPTRIEKLAAYYLNEIRAAQPTGPYLVGGLCLGAFVAFEMARQLQTQGERVALLAVVEPAVLQAPGLGSYLDFGVFLLRRFVQRFDHHSRTLAQQSSPERGAYFRLKMKAVANTWALRRYAPQPYPGSIHLFLTRESLESPRYVGLNWPALAVGGVEVHGIPGTHDTIIGTTETPIDEAHIQALAKRLRACIDELPEVDVRSQT